MFLPSPPPRKVKSTALCPVVGSDTHARSVISLPPLVFSCSARSLLRQLIHVASENYPESISRMFFINTPRLFTAVWGTLQGWLRQRTISKIILLGEVSPYRGSALEPWR